MSIYLYIYIDLDSSLSIIDNDESKQIICDQISVPPFFCQDIPGVAWLSTNLMALLSSVNGPKGPRGWVKICGIFG